MLVDTSHCSVSEGAEGTLAPLAGVAPLGAGVGREAVPGGLMEWALSEPDESIQGEVEDKKRRWWKWVDDGEVVWCLVEGARNHAQYSANHLQCEAIRVLGGAPPNLF